MLRVHSNTNLEGYTEFEEHITFDNDDPDFNHEVASLPGVPIVFRSEALLYSETHITLETPNVPSNMSLASVHPAELHSSHSSLATLSHSLDDISACSWGSQVQSDHVMTIEELRLQMSSCFTCGVSWNDSHVSLDCAECGGYALERPCPACEGACGAVWKRDLSLSHACGKARWQGECKFDQQKKEASNTSSSAVAQELSSRLERLSANS